MNAAELQIQHLCSFAQPPDKSRVPFCGAKSFKKKNFKLALISHRSVSVIQSCILRKGYVIGYPLGLTALSADDP